MILTINKDAEHRPPSEFHGRHLMCSNCTYVTESNRARIVNAQRTFRQIKMDLPENVLGQALPLNAGNFISRWQQSSAAERANYALFLSELCDYLDLPRPNPSQADEDANAYVIDKAVYFQNLDGSSTTNYTDL